MAHEREQELELEFGEAHHLAVDPDLAGRPVDLEVAVPVRRGLLDRDRGGQAAAADQHLDAAAQLLDAERLRQVVVRPVGGDASVVVPEVGGGEHQDGHVGEVADAVEHLPPVHLGEPDVEDHQVGAFLEEVAEPVAPVARHHARAILLGNHPPDRLGDRGVVLDDEDPRGPRGLLGAQGCGHVGYSLLCAANGGARAGGTDPRTRGGTHRCQILPFSIGRWGPALSLEFRQAPGRRTGSIAPGERPAGVTVTPGGHDAVPREQSDERMQEAPPWTTIP